MERTKEGLEKALSELPALHEEFKTDLRVTGGGDSVNQTLEKAGRVDDFFELGMLMCRDALERANRAAATSAPSTRRRTARPSATTSTSPTSRRGSGPATRWRRRGTRKQLEYEVVHFQTRSYK